MKRGRHRGGQRICRVLAYRFNYVDGPTTNSSQTDQNGISILVPAVSDYASIPLKEQPISSLK
jgi:hypothetical protein